MTERENAYTREDLKIMQSWDLERKIRVTQTRIMEWYQHYDGKAYVSFSGGKDSTVLLDLARRIYPDIPAVFVDTGLEYPSIRSFVKTKENVTWLKPDMSFKEVIETYGYPVGTKRTASNIEYGRKALARGDLEMYNYYVKGYRYNKKNGEEYRFMPIAQKFMDLFESDIKVSSRCCGIMKKSHCTNIKKKQEKSLLLQLWQRKVFAELTTGLKMDAMPLTQKFRLQHQ